MGKINGMLTKILQQAMVVQVATVPQCLYAAKAIFNMAPDVSG